MHARRARQPAAPRAELAHSPAIKDRFNGEIPGKRELSQTISILRAVRGSLPIHVRPRKLRVAVLFGGRSAEHEISLLSARNVVEALDRERFEPVLVGIDKSGRWLLQEEALLLGAGRDPRLAKLNEAMPGVSLAAHPGASGAGSLTIGAEAPAGIDVVFPVLHGPMGKTAAFKACSSSPGCLTWERACSALRRHG